MVRIAGHPPLVSAIIIFLNEGRFLEEAIESVLSQSYPHWELLLVDDGSSDDSSRIGIRFANDFPDKVRLLEHPGHENKGMSASRNLGVAAAKGDFIAFLDGDDVWLPDKLLHQLEVLQSQPDADMVVGPIIEWHSWTGREEDRERDGLYCVGDDGRHPLAGRLVPAPHLLALFLRDERFVPSGFMVRRTAALRVGGFENEFRGSYEDAVFQVKLCLSAGVFVDDEALYKYRIHPDSCERRTIRAKQHIPRRLAYLKWVAGFLSHQEHGDPVLSSALHEALWPARHPILHTLIDRYRRHRAKLLDGLRTVARRTLGG